MIKSVWEWLQLAFSTWTTHCFEGLSLFCEQIPFKSDAGVEHALKAQMKAFDRYQQALLRDLRCFLKSNVPILH